MSFFPTYEAPPPTHTTELFCHASRPPGFTSSTAGDHKVTSTRHVYDQDDVSDAELSEEKAGGDDTGSDKSGGETGRSDDDMSSPSDMVEDPSTDIQGDLEHALGGDLDFKRPFHFEHSYTNVPNPMLRLAGFGCIGLPLNPAEARRMIPYLSPTSFEAEERAIAAMPRGDIREIDASKVCLDAANWNAFIVAVVNEACKHLGVDVAVSLPHCELHKLLLYKEGSYLLPHQITERASGMFATMTVLLPSSFTGGEDRLSHTGDNATLVGFSPSSWFATSVLLSYTGVTHEMRPISSGFRLALSYNLIHTSNAPRPSLPDFCGVVSALRRTFQSWQQGLSGGPEKIVYLLDHQYSLPEMRQGNVFEGRDALLVGLLEPLVGDLGFRLGLATLEYVETGPAEGPGIDPHYEWDGSLCDIDPEKLYLVDVDEREISITNLIDLKGQPLANGSKVVSDEECIPTDLQDVIGAGVPYDRVYEGSDCGGELTVSYRRTVLVIWPIANTNLLISNSNRRADRWLSNTTTWATAP